MINERQSLNYNEVFAALMDYEVRRQDRLSSSESTTAETLAVRGRNSNRGVEVIKEDQSPDQVSKI